MVVLQLSEWRSGNMSGWAAGSAPTASAPTATPRTVYAVPNSTGYARKDHSGHNVYATRGTRQYSATHRYAPSLAEWRDAHRNGVQPSQPPSAYARKPFERPVIHRPTPDTPRHRAAPHRDPTIGYAKPRRTAPRLDAQAKWAQPRHANPAQNLDARTLRKMLHEAGIECSERDVALILHDAHAGTTPRQRDQLGPPLDVGKLIASLLEQQAEAGKPRPSRYLPHTLAQGHSLPFDVPKRLQYCFDAIDADKSGFLEGSEITEALRRYGIDTSSGKGAELVKKACGADGRLDFEEFALLVAHLEETRRVQRQLSLYTATVTPRPPGAPSVWRPPQGL